MGGRPLDGMCPAALSEAGDILDSRVITLILEAEPANNTTLMRFQYQRTQDPVERYDKILDILQTAYFQHPGNFCDTLSALFGPMHPTRAKLLHLGRCVLMFEQFRQCYRLPCSVRELSEDDPFFQATFWHNAMFNPNLPAGLHILAFRPDWSHASEWQKQE